jgi:hypothetical protein
MKPSEQNPSVSPMKTPDQTQPVKGAPDDKKPDAGKSPYTPRPGNEAKSPLHAAKGNDEVMSQQPQKQT